MKRKNLLITCTKVKKKGEGLTALERYSPSAMFRHLVELSDRQNLALWIRSGKFGFITPGTLVPEYDFRASANNSLFSTSSYPEGGGYWCGAGDYFFDAPERYTRLLPKMTYGNLGSAISWLKTDLNLRQRWFNGSPLPTIRELIINYFAGDGGTVRGCVNYLNSTLNDQKDFTKAVKSILSDKHKHRGYNRYTKNGIIMFIKKKEIST